MQSGYDNVVKGHSLWPSIYAALYKPEELSLCDLQQVHSDIKKLQKDVSKEIGVYPSDVIILHIANMIEDCLIKAEKQNWALTIPDCARYQAQPYQLFNEDIIVLGYKCVNINVSFDVFVDIAARWFTPEEYSSDEAFYKKLDDACCTDWNKMDDHGELYGGFYKYPKDSYEWENAYTLTREFNLQKLCSLPYPRAAILYIIDLTCGARRESVLTTVNLCEWFVRKKALMTIRHRPFSTFCQHVQKNVLFFLWMTRKGKVPRDVQRMIVQIIIEDNVPCLICAKDIFNKQ